MAVVLPLKWAQQDIYQSSPTDILSGGGIQFNQGGTFLQLVPPAGVPVSVTWKLPNADGLPGQVLQTDGHGNLSWITVQVGPGPKPPFFIHRDLLNTVEEVPFTWHMGGARTTPTVFHRLMALMSMEDPNGGSSTNGGIT